MADVDAVITWVDGNDQKLIEKRDYWARLEDESRHTAKGMRATRFACNGEIWFNIHFLRKNAPWIDKIFVVTDSQTPEWLTEDVQNDLNVSIIDHKTIFKGYEEFLPVFSSRSIETMLPFIPEISEQFLYLNDDFFMINPTMKSDYFTADGQVKLKWRGRWVNEKSLKGRLLRKVSGLARIAGLSYNDSDGFVGRRAERILMGSRYFKEYFSLAHAPYPVDQVLMKEMLRTTNLLRANIGYKFRSQKQFWPIAFLAHYGFDHDKSLVGENDWAYISCLRHSEREILNRLNKCRLEMNIKSLCVQSLDSASESCRKLISDFLTEKLDR